MTNHPNRSNRPDKETRLVQDRAAEFEAKRRGQNTMPQTAKHTPLIESLLEAVFIGRTMRPGDKAMVREALRLQRANAELLAALTGLLETIEKHTTTNKSGFAANAVAWWKQQARTAIANACNK